MPEMFFLRQQCVKLYMHIITQYHDSCHTLTYRLYSWLVIMWMLSNIIAISFNLHLKWTFTCTVCSTCKQNQDNQSNCVMLKEITCEEMSQN